MYGIYDSENFLLNGIVANLGSSCHMHYTNFTFNLTKFN